MSIVLPITKGFRMDDDLMPGIDQRLAIVALQDAVGRKHFRRLVIGDVTLQLIALLAAFGVVRGQEGLDAGGLLLQALEVVVSPLLLSATCSSGCLLFLLIGSLVLGQHLLELLLQLLLLAPQVSKRAAPFLG